MRIQTLFAPFALGALATFLAVAPAPLAHAQMMGGHETATATDAEGAAGAVLRQKLSSGATSCAALSESDFDALGDYFMGVMMGPMHEAMDRAMTNALSASGERQMHVAMGERLSGCNLSAAYPAGANGFFPGMMGMMTGMSGFGGMRGTGFGGPMAGYGYGFGSWVVVLGTVLLWALALIGLVASVRWLVSRSGKS